MNKKKYYRGEINLLYFFLVSLIIHLMFFIGKQYNAKNDFNLKPNMNSAPITVQVRSNTFKLPRPSEQPSAPKEEVKKVEPIKPKEEPKKEAKKQEFESKIQDKKKKLEKKEEIKSVTPETKTVEKGSENVEKKEASASSVPANVPTDKNSDQDFLSGNFTVGADGNIIASSSEGIDYNILRQVEPEYPQMAKSVGYSKVVVVKVKFLVGLNGKVEDIKFIQSHSKLGFDKAVTEALHKWEFKPIYYKGKNIKVYFTKEFMFQNEE